MIFKSTKINYYERLLRALVLPIVVIVFTYFYVNFQANEIWIPALIFILIYLRYLHWYKYYLIEIDFQEKNICLIYYRYNKIIEKKLITII